MVFLICSLVSLANADDQRPRRVILGWKGDEYAHHYDVVVEKEEIGRYQLWDRKPTDMFPSEFFLVFYLIPGRYHYKVIAYNLSNELEGETTWVSFFVPKAVVLEDGEDSGVEDIIIQFEPESAAEDAAVDGLEEKTNTEPEKTPLIDRMSMGISLGTTFTAPLAIGTLRGTVDFWQYFFAELGCDFGTGCKISGIGYYSVYPFFHLALFLPFAERYGWYIGGGYGCMYAKYTSPEGELPINTLAFDVVSGFTIKDRFDISYTLRKGVGNDKGVNHKVSIGYIYRFKNRNKTAENTEQMTEDSEETIEKSEEDEERIEE